MSGHHRGTAMVAEIADEWSPTSACRTHDALTTALQSDTQDTPLYSFSGFPWPRAHFLFVVGVSPRAAGSARAL